MWSATHVLVLVIFAIQSWKVIARMEYEKCDNIDDIFECYAECWSSEDLIPYSVCEVCEEDYADCVRDEDCVRDLVTGGEAKTVPRVALLSCLQKLTCTDYAPPWPSTNLVRKLDTARQALMGGPWDYICKECRGEVKTCTDKIYAVSNSRGVGINPNDADTDTKNVFTGNGGGVRKKFDTDRGNSGTFGIQDGEMTMSTAMLMMASSVSLALVAILFINYCKFKKIQEAVGEQLEFESLDVDVDMNRMLIEPVAGRTT
eukprot:m.176153 g.176153  ORF g.176153 m.176153 type:complete len:259 (-) comp15438_c0_seq9:1745-2521(-)